MSTTIDERVVEMRFDNQQFERNVSTTMSTLDKLKKLLHFDGASKGLESVNSAAKNVNMAGLGTAVETVSTKFSALQVVGVTALANITNSAVNAGKRIVSALTIDPVKTGFQEYETQINAVQTILANTSSKGTTIDEVNAALEELNKYADMTIYNFTEMTRNIGTFTAAGIDLETSVNAIQGIANLAAVSGSTSQQASTAMYQLSQALAAGTIRLMDWNSVVNAGMGGEVFQNALRETSEALGTGAEAAIEASGSFRESLRDGWLTSEVLTETLKKFTSSGANEYVAEYTGLSVEAVESALSTAEATYGEAEAIEYASKALAEKSGRNKDEIADILNFAKTATDAATKVKTFTQLWDVLKESAQSGWSQTWKLIIGDFEEAKSLLTPLADTLTGFINRMSDFRNRILEVALDFSKPWTSMMDKLGNVKKVVNNIEQVTDKLEYFQDVVNKVWRGDYNNQGDDPDRRDLLKAAGYDPRVVQDLVNKGYQYKLTVEDIEASHKKFGLTLETTQEETEEAANNFAELSDEKLKDAGLTEDEIALYRAMEAEADRLGISVSELADKMSETDGRSLLIESFKNFGDVFVGIGKAAKEAWVDIFNPPGAEVLGVRLYGILESLKQFTETLRLTDKETGKLTENGEKIRRTFEGVFAVIDIVTTIIGGGFKMAFKIVTELLSRFDLNILDVTAAIGDVLVGFHDWFEGILNVSGAVDFLVPLVKNAAKFITSLIEAVKNSKWFGVFCEYVNKAADGLANLFANVPNTDAFQNLVNVLKKAGDAVRDWIATLKDSENIPADIIAGLVKGITKGIPAVLTAVFELAKSIISGICEVLGIASPAKTMIAIGGFIIAGLIQGILEGKISLINTAESLAENIWLTLKAAFTYLGERVVGLVKGVWDIVADENGNVQWGKIIAGGMMGTVLWVLVQFAKAVKGLAEGIDGIGDLLDETSNVMKKFGKVLDGYAWDLKAKALQKLAIAVAILVAAVVVLTQIDDIGKMWNAVAIIGALTLILVGLAVAMDKFASTTVDFDQKKIEGLKTGLLQIALCLGVLTLIVKMIGNMDPEKAKQGFLGLTAIAIGLLGFMAVLGLISKYSKDVKQFGSLMLKLAIAMMLMVTVIRLVNGLNADEILNGILFAAGFALFVNSITRVAKSAGNNVSKVGGMILKLTIAMALMVGVVKLASMLSPEEMLKGAAFAAGFTIFVWALVKCTKIGKKQQLANLGGLIMAVSFSLMLMVGVCKLVGLLSVEEILKGAAFAAGFTVLLKTLVSILSIGNEQKMAKVGGTILAMSVAIGILAAVSVLLSYVDLAGLVKGVTAVSILCGMMTLMVRGLKGAQNVSKSIMMMAIAVGVMAAAIVALTFIDDTKQLMAAAGALSIVMGMFALIEKNSKKIGKSIGAIAVMVVAVGLLAGILYLLTNNISNADAAIKVAISLSILMGALAVSLKIMGGLAATSTAALPAMGVMLLVVAGLAVILGVLDALDVEPSIETATALSILLLAMAGVTAVLTVVGAGAPLAEAGVVAFSKVVIGLGILMAGLGGLVELFPKLQTWLDSGIDILQKIGEGIGRFIGGFIGGIGEGMMDSLNDMVDTFGKIVEKLVTISDTGTNIKTEGFDGVKKLIEVIGDIALLTVGTSWAELFNGFGTSMDKFQTNGVAFFKAMAAIGEASSGVTIDEEGLTSITTAAGKLVELQASIEPIGGLASYLLGHTDLATFGTNVKAFIDQMKLALGGLAGFSYNTEGLDAITTAAGELATLQSSLEPIWGIAQFFTGHSDLTTFGTNVCLFIDEMKLALGSLMGFTFDDMSKAALTAIIDAATQLSTLQTALEPIGGVITWFNGRDDLATFGTNIGSFITSMKTALSNLEGATLDEESLASVITAAEKLANLQEKLEPMNTVITWFTGRTDLGTFGVNIGLFADAMGKLKTAMGENGMSEEAVASIATAGNAINELQKALPEETWFDGKMNLSEFSDYITEFGTAMGEFAKTAAEIDSAAVSTTINTAYRIKGLIESLVGLDTSGLTTFTGIGTGGWGADGAAYKIAQAMSKYSEEVAGIDTAAVSTSATVASKLKNLIASLVGLDTSGIENFKIDSIGKSMKSYANKVKDLDPSIVSSSITAASRLKTFISSLAGLDTSGISNFKVDTIGTALKDYSSSVKGFKSDVVSSSISAANKIKNFISSLTGFDAGGASSFKSAIDELSTVDVGRLVKAFSGASDKMLSAGTKMMDGLVKGLRSKSLAVTNVIKTILNAMSREVTSKLSMFEKAGATLVSRLATGTSSKKGAVKTAVTSCIAAAATAIRTYYKSFNSAGSYLGSGLVSGINSKQTAVYRAGYALGQKAVQGEKDGQKSNSPSKLTIQSGKWFGEGLVIGIKQMGDKVYNAGHDLGDTAVKSLSSTVSRIATAIDSDIDVQPTIRPVLDLSDVRSGAGAISGMLDIGSSVGVLANVGAISNAMNSRSQNGGNSEVVSAINKLRKDLGNVGNTNYTINGITYDDGSNIATAVKDLTRYARMERRV